MLRGGISQAFKKWLMFSIWIKGIWLFLNLIPGGGRALLASSHSAVPSLRASKRSPGGSERPRVSSIHVRASLAACGVYLDRRRLRMSESSEVTDGIVWECCYCCSLGEGPAVSIKCGSCEAVLIVIAQYRTNVDRDRECLDLMFGQAITNGR